MTPGPGEPQGRRCSVVTDLSAVAGKLHRASFSIGGSDRTRTRSNRIKSAVPVPSGATPSGMVLKRKTPPRFPGAASTLLVCASAYPGVPS